MAQLPMRTTPWKDPSLPAATISVRARGMAAAGEELPPKGGGRGEAAEGGVVADGDEAAFFDLDLAGLIGKASFQAGEEEKGGEEEAAGDATTRVPGAEAAPPENLRRLRALVRRLTRPSAAASAAVGGGGAAPPEEKRRAQSARRSRVGAVSTDEEERRAPAPGEAAAKHLVGKTPPPPARRRRGLGEPSPPPLRPRATAAAVRPGRKSRGEDGLREACRRLSIGGRASTAGVATPPAPPRQRRDDSLRQAQDDIASAIAHCKLSLDHSPRGEIAGDVRLQKKSFAGGGA
ncbi:hypothetical protein ACP4OV_016023 [Aristida adscensionis]